MQVTSQVQGPWMSYNYLHDRVSQIEWALFDLGASVNLLPYSVYLQLGLGELKPTSMTLQLVDQFVKISQIGRAHV